MCTMANTKLSSELQAAVRAVEVQKHFVTFYSPGTFCAEESTREVDAWDTAHAVALAAKIEEWYGARPFGFRFTTRSRGVQDLDSKVSVKSPMYYLPHCKIETLAEIEARNDPKEGILRDNLRINGYDRVVTTTTGWKWTALLEKDDVVLEG
jgi:hypothetical protein